MLKGPWLGVFLCALVLRLLFLFVMTAQFEGDAFLTTCTDADTYNRAATEIRNAWNFDTLGVETFGPGYPVFLALLQLVTGGSAVLMMLAQIILSSVGSVLLFLWANALTGDRKVALIAGLLNSFSLTSISLANILLSETLAFVMLVSGLLIFLKANDSGHRRLYLAAAALLAGASLVRSMNQFLFLLLPLLAWLLYPAKIGRQGRAIWSLVTCAVVVLMLGLWTQQFYRKHHVMALAASQLGGVSQIVCLTHIRVEHTTGGWARAWSDSLVRARTDELEGRTRALSIFAWEYLAKYLREQPKSVVAAFVESAWYNVNNESGLQELQLPKWAGAFSRSWAFIEKYYLNYRATLLALIGGIILLYRQRYRLLTTLLLIYGYFAALSAFSMWQTSRIFYPGQIAGSVLIAITLAALYELGRNWTGKVLQRWRDRECKEVLL